MSQLPVENSEPQTDSYLAKSPDVGINVPSDPPIQNESDKPTEDPPPPSRTKISVYFTILGLLMLLKMGLSGLTIHYIWEYKEANKKWNEIIESKQKFPRIKNDTIFGGKLIREITGINNALEKKIKKHLHREDPTYEIVFYVVSVFLVILFLYFIVFLVIKKVRLNLQVTAILYAVDAMVLFCAGVFLLIALTRVNLRYLRARIYFERTWDPQGHNASCVRTAIDDHTVSKYGLDVQETINETQHDIDADIKHGRSGSASGRCKKKPDYCCYVKDVRPKQDKLFAVIKTCAYMSTKKNPRDPCKDIPVMIVNFGNRNYSGEDLTDLLICPDEFHLRIILYMVGATLVSTVLVLWFASHAKHALMKPTTWKKTLPLDDGHNKSRDWKSKRRIPSFMLTDFNTDTAVPTTAKHTATIDNLIDTPYLHPKSKRQTRIMELFPGMILHPPPGSRSGSVENLHTSTSLTFHHHKTTKSTGKIETLNSTSPWFSDSD